VGPCLPIVLVERILDRNDGVFLHVAQVKVRELNTGDPFAGVRVRVLEVQIVLAVLEELRRGDVEGYFDFAFITGFFDGLGQKLKGFLSTRDVGSKTTLVSDIDSYSTCILA
jgi:hypothetical protein